MIRINLLPFRAARKKENVRRQLSIYFLSVIFSVLLLGYIWLTKSQELRSLKKERIVKEKKLQTYKDTLKKIAVLEARNKEIKRKLKVIDNLNKSKTGPVRLLDDLASSVPEGRLFLKSLKESKGKMTLRGSAEDNDTVALFMDRLKEKKRIISVDLVSAKRSEIKTGEDKISVTDFTLNCQITSH
jgi:type IV pilus assembly protein PilN